MKKFLILIMLILFVRIAAMVYDVMLLGAAHIHYSIEDAKELYWLLLVSMGIQIVYKFIDDNFKDS